MVQQELLTGIIQEVQLEAPPFLLLPVRFTVHFSGWFPSSSAVVLERVVVVMQLRVSSVWNLHSFFSGAKAANHVRKSLNQFCFPLLNLRLQFRYFQTICFSYMSVKMHHCLVFSVTKYDFCDLNQSKAMLFDSALSESKGETEALYRGLTVSIRK